MKSESPRRYVSWYKNMFIQISKENTSYTFRNDKEKQAQKCHENQMYKLKWKGKITGASDLLNIKIYTQKIKEKTIPKVKDKSQVRVKEITGAGELNKVKAEQLWEARH